MGFSWKNRPILVSNGELDPLKEAVEVESARES